MGEWSPKFGIMASALFSFLFLLFNLSAPLAASDPLFEDGYTVTTVYDGKKSLNSIYPFSILPRPGSRDILLLDSHSSAFYTASLPISKESRLDLFAGNGEGFSDGGLTTAKFNHPRDFAVDTKGNVYVADKNGVIRKISKTGVTTIAGGLGREGTADGPGRNASFSNSFNLAFIPEICALMISDHGTRLIRQINLKPEECVEDSPHTELGLAAASMIGVLCLLAGAVTGFAARPYVFPHGGTLKLPICKEIWKLCQINLGTQIQITSSDVRSAVASSAPFKLLDTFVRLIISQLCLMFGVNALMATRRSQTVSVSSADRSKEKSLLFQDPVKDLISFDVGAGVPGLEKPNEQATEMVDVSESRFTKIEKMIESSISAFVNEAREEGKIDSYNSGFGRRKPFADDNVKCSSECGWT
ncbi:hypothetical protein H6P81_008696 [Aristolochia fimbriata]|uniref:NHL repeat-containing protein n=1 Tax=Aristolochia fimbriata TaxID=158543 RepID=A0AAV7EK12_ARIFI|nr:hypothetical protein H6P81_008696 [Aristolochia fimbriata]